MPSIRYLRQAVEELIVSTTDLPKRTRLRLAFLVFGVLLSGSIVLRRIATTSALVEPSATLPASHERRLRRTLHDPQLSWAATYARTVRRILRRPSHGPWVVILDESGHTEVLRTLVAALWYRGRAIPLAWVVWTGQAPHEQAYWIDTAGVVGNRPTPCRAGRPARRLETRPRPPAAPSPTVRCDPTAAVRRVPAQAARIRHTVPASRSPDRPCSPGRATQQRVAPDRRNRADFVRWGMVYSPRSRRPLCRPAGERGRWAA